MTSSLGKLAKVVGIAFGARELIKFGASAIEVASDVQEVQNVVDTAFGSMAYKMEEFADAAVESFGISKLTAKQTGSTFMAMASGMNLTSEYASDLAIQLTALSADMASFYNVDQSVASTALKSIFTGETETLKQFGVVMTEVNLQEYALSKGIDEAISSMNQQEKVMLRAEYVTEQLALASGDFAKTQDSWANQTRILTERWKEFKAVIGTGLITALTPALQFLNTFLQRLIDVANAIGTVMSKIFGIKAQKFTSTASVATDATDSIASGLDNVTGSADKASKAVKNAQAAFDDIDVLHIAEDSTGSGSGAGGGSTIDVTDMEETSSTFDEIQEKIKILGVSVDDLKQSFSEGWENGFKTDKLEETAQNFRDIKKSLVEIFTDKEVQKSFDEFANQLSRTAGTVAGASASVAISVTNGITGGVKNALDNPIVKDFSSNKIANIIKNLTDIVAVVEDFASASAEVALAFESPGFKKIVEFFTELGIAVGLSRIENITGFFKDLLELNFAPFTENADHLRRSLELVFEIIGNLIAPAEDLLEAFMANDQDYEDSFIHKALDALTDGKVQNAETALTNLNAVLSGFAEATSVAAEDWDAFFENKDEILEQFGQSVGQLFSRQAWDAKFSVMGQSLSVKFAEMKAQWIANMTSWWNNNVAPWFTKEKWERTFENIKVSLTTKWDETAGQWIQNISTWWAEDVAPWFTLERWKQLGTNMAYGIGRGFGQIVQQVRDTINGVIAAIESGINQAIQSVNNLIANYNSIPVAPDVPTLGNVHIPRLAQGAVFQGGSPYMAIVNDQPAGQTNVETPLATIQEALQNVIDGQQGYGGGTAQLILDGQVVGTLLFPYLQGENNRIGTTLVIP